MAITVTPGTKTIYIPQSYLTLLGTAVQGTEVYELDVDQLRLDLKDWEDSEEGMAEPDTHRHNTQVEISGITYARQIVIHNGWIVDFQDTGTPYIVSCTGANHNIQDVTDFSGGNVSMLPNNSGGLVTGLEATVESGTYTVNVVESLRLILAAMTGKLSGAPGPGTITIRDINDGVDRISATVDANGNRTAVTLDAD